MKNLAKTLFAVVAALGMGAAYAATLQSATIPFTSTGDTYADGSPVIDNEWYVLCWSANEKFGGLNADLTVKVEGDKVFCKAPLAENGGCDVTFVVNTPPTGGNYFVIMLDTRVDATTLAGKNAQGVPATVNGTGVARAVAIAELGSSNWATTVLGSGVAAYNPVAGENFKPAKISGITVDGDQAIITVSDMSVGAKYIVKSGATLDKINSTGLTEAKAGTFTNGGKEDFKFVIDSNDAKFFQVFLAE